MVYILFLLSSFLVIGFLSYYKLLKYNRKLISELQQTNHDLNLLNRKIKKHVSDELILKNEIQHRVRNNLQQIISILSILYIKNGIDVSEDLIYNKFFNRIKVLILVQEAVLNKKKYNFIRFTEDITKQIKQNENYINRNIKINISCNVTKLYINDATLLGMLVYELTTNSFQFSSKSSVIEISLKQNSYNQIEFFFNDFGEGYNHKQKSINGIGLELVELLVLQLKGKIINKTNSQEGLIIIFNNNFK